MRTTLTIDDDVAALLDSLRRMRGADMKAIVNEALRRGLQEMTAPRAPRETFRTRSVSLGRLRVGSIDNIAEALAIAEGDGFR
jgi:hypothetical protein